MTVVLCVTVLNRWEQFRQFLASIAQLEPADQFELRVSDWGSTDVDLAAKLASTRYRRSIGRISGQPSGTFNRSFGLNVLARNRLTPDQIVCFLDADIWVPPNFLQQLQLRVTPGTCWFPVCYSLYAGRPREVWDDEPPLAPLHQYTPQRANGWWREAGKGLCAFTAADWQQLGGWDEQIGATYGEEDGDLFRRAEALGLTVLRNRCQGLFHVWHAPSDEYRKRYEGIQS